MLKIINKLLKDKFYFFIALLVILIFIFMVCISPEYFIYDEAHYFSNTELLRNSSNTLSFLREMKGPVGPLPNFIQFLFGPVFDFNLRFLRFINLFLVISTSLLLNIYFFGKEKLNNKKNYINFFVPTVVSFSLPFTWIIAGMALTEAGSVFFTMLSLIFLAKYIQNKYSTNLYLFISSFSSALASIGRQTLIVLSPILFIFFIYLKKANRIKEAFIYFLLSLSLPAILFLIWGGIIPQDYHVTLFAETGRISIKNLILSIGYLGFSFLFVCPSLISKNIFSYKGIFVFIFAIIPSFFIKIEDYPLKSVVNNLFVNPQINKLIGLLFPIISLFIGLILFSIMIERFRKIDTDEIEKISWIMIILIMLSNMVITHQFSARYLAVGLAPIITIGSSLIRVNSSFDRLGNVLGILLGIMSLSSYYDFF